MGGCVVEVGWLSGWAGELQAHCAAVEQSYTPRGFPKRPPPYACMGPPTILLAQTRQRLRHALIHQLLGRDAQHAPAVGPASLVPHKHPASRVAGLLLGGN